MTEPTIGALVADGARRLAVAVGDEVGRIEARALLRRVLNFDEAKLLARATDCVAEQVATDFEQLMQRRLAGEPVAYIVGNCEFMGLDFLTTPAALVPRPETEEMTEAALLHLPQNIGRVLDLGTGCGAIGLTIARAKEKSHILLSDASEQTLDLAQKNARHLGVANANFHCGDWFSQMNSETFDLIVSNPPYVAANDTAMESLRYEPLLALDGGADGLRSLRAVIGGAPRHLTAGGVLLVEHGANQAAAVRDLFAEAGFCGTRCARDLAGHSRFTLGVRGGGRR